MAEQIKDGEGSGRLAGVDVDKRLKTTSKVLKRAAYVCRDDERLFSWHSTYTATASDVLIYIKNDSTTLKLYIERIEFSCASNCIFDVVEVTGTAAGTAITPKNMNTLSAVLADATELGNAAVTGTSTDGAAFARTRVLANDTKDIIFGGSIIIGQGKAVAIIGSASAVTDVTIIGWFE